MKSIPPMVPFNRTMMNSIVRGSSFGLLEENSVTFKPFTIQTMISGFSQLVSCFTEIKILKVFVWMTTTMPTSSTGVITMITTPTDEFAQPTKVTYQSLAAVPGAITRKVYQTLHGVYYPTEPKEKDWFKIDDNKTFFNVYWIGKDLPTGDAIRKINDYQLIWDAHIKVRGRVVPMSTTEEGLPFRQATNKAKPPEAFESISSLDCMAIN
jgi:hypothetical protein